MIVRLFIGEIEYTRFNSVLEIMLYATIGVIVYLVLSIKNNLITDVFGDDLANKLLKKFKRIKK